MKRFTLVAAVVSISPLLACDRAPAPDVDEPLPTHALAPVDDLRPDVGRAKIGADLTELARKQNTPANEPKVPTDKGVVKRARLLPKVRRTDKGFVASFPDATNVPTPAYHQGRIFTGGFGTHEFHAINPQTGKPAWSLHLSDDGPTAPACKEGVCVFNTYSCTIFSVAADTGKHLWSWWLGSPQLATPVIAGNVVYTSYPGDSGPDGAPFVLAAFHLKTGEPLWRRWIDAEVNSTPVAYRGRVYVATQRGTLYEFGADDGKVVAVRQNRVASPPVVTGEGMFFPRDDVSADNDMLAAAHPILTDFDLSPVMAPEVTPRPRPLVAQHRLLTVEEGVVVATNRKTGEPLWQRRLDDEQAANVEAPLFFAGNSVLLATSRGNVVRMTADTGDVMSTFELGQGDLASQPIVHAGWIYAGTMGGSLVGFDTGYPELTGWEMLGGGPDRQGVADAEDS